MITLDIDNVRLKTSPP